MAIYIKKPVIIEAFQFIYAHLDKCIENAPQWFKDAIDNETVYKSNDGHYAIKTLEGDHYISNEDYVIRGVSGELYPCKPDIFYKTYDKIGD